MLAEKSASRSRQIAEINAKDQAKELQSIRALKQMSSFLKQKDSTNFQLTYSDLNALCNTNTFVDHSGWEMQSFLNGPFGKEFGNSEVGFWLFLVRKKMEEPDPRFGNFAFYENSDSPEFVQMVEKKLTKKNFQLLKTAYLDIPSQARPYIEKNRDFLIQEERRQKELTAAIAREQLPELRIRELKLPIPRGAQNAWDFENICRDWLEAWGDTNVQVTQRSGDGGIDVLSDHCVAQVKFYSDKPVGRPELQQLKGAAVPYGDPEVVFLPTTAIPIKQSCMQKKSPCVCLISMRTLAHLTLEIPTQMN